MCGIAGIIAWKPRPSLRADIQAMTRALAHRGPDGEGIWSHDQVALGHRRLSIIDPRGGRQPMRNEDGSIWLTFNGEIYNFKDLRSELQGLGHHFATRSDSEVIVHGYEQWGSGCVERFRGMFAFAIVDLRLRRLVLARDRLGIKPLVLRVGSDYVAFASEIQALRELQAPQPVIRVDAIEYFLRYQYIPAPHTIFQDFYKLPAAHVAELRLDEPGARDRFQARRYWRHRFVFREARSERECLDEVEAGVRDAVHSHLVSDVPFGVLLSGGVDSTLVASEMAALLPRPIDGFTIDFPQQQFSELAHASQAAQSLDITLHTRVVDTELATLVPRILWHYGEPFGDTSMIPTWKVCELARHHVPMVLSGDGGDELFAGYDTYRYWAKRTLRQRVLEFSETRSLSTLKAAARTILRDRTWLPDHMLEGWMLQMSLVRQPQRRALWHPEYWPLIDRPNPTFARTATEAPRWHPVEFAQSVDIHTWLPDDILVKVDIASMAHGLEVRPPLLDHHLAELAGRLPASLRLDLRHGKHMGKRALKLLLERRFPAAFVHRQKQGFGLPRAQWFAPGSRPRTQLADLIDDEASRLHRLFRRNEMRQLLASHAPEHDRSPALWLLYVLGIWLRDNPEATLP